ncbi:MAG: glycosyltransferase 87 family protein [Saprospiraceae bacterium]|nr:glycosyltransferase 87 family protein [Saprospiraceae bacterium]
MNNIFKFDLSVKDYKTRFLFLFGFFIILFFIMQNINDRFWLNDFKVYYSSTKAFLSGEQIYGVSHGLSSGFFKYSPFSLILYVPLAILPFGVAKIIFFFLTAFFAATTILISESLFKEYFENSVLKNGWILFTVFIVIATHLYRELHLGNVNLLLLLFSLVCLSFLLKEKNISAGLMYALIVLLKPHFLVLLPLLILRKKFKTTITFIASLFIGFLFPVLFVGFSGNTSLHQAWLSTMKTHNVNLIESQETIYSWIYKIINPILNISSTNVFMIVVLLIVGALILWLVLSNFKNEKKDIYKQKDLSFTFEFVLLIALIPNITHTDSEHFLLSLPLIFVVIQQAFYSKPKNYLVLILSIIAFLLYGGNFYDLLGKDLSLWVTKTGFLGLGNVIIILISIYIFKRNLNVRLDD